MSSQRLLTGLVAGFAAMTLIAPTFAFAAGEGDLIKTSCAEGAGADDQCRAVYYLGVDEQRHLFPNQDVFYSWFDDFSGVVEIGTDEMSGYDMGKNVTVKPGSKLVKFQSGDAVYAVSEGGVLRHYLTPELVAADYGLDWYTRDLVTMPDTLFNDYQVGEDIDNSADYDPSEAERGVLSIDDNF